MCSFFDFIEKQKFFIESEQKRIESLFKFLNEFDKQLTNESIYESNQIENTCTQLRSNQTNANSDAHKNNYVSHILEDSPVTQKDIQNSDDLMFDQNDDFSWFRLNFNSPERKRKRLADERKKEYKEYLKEKSRIESERQKRKLNNFTRIVAPNYNDLLYKKRIEERKNRELNGMNNIEEMECEEQTRDDNTRDSQFKTSGWFNCYNNEFITPRSRLLATDSSRVKAAQYREQLDQQIAEKKRLKEEERERIRLKEIELEHRIKEQRIKMLREYETEQRNLRKKTDEVIKRQEMLKMKPNMGDIYPTNSPLSVLRSPRYLQAREERAMRSPHKQTHNNKVSRSLATTMHSDSTQTKHSNINPIISSSRNTTKLDQNFDSSADALSSESETEIIPEQYKKSNPLLNSVLTDSVTQSSEPKRDSRVMSQLTEVRQMMESNHIKMLEQLRQQQIQQQLIDHVF